MPHNREVFEIRYFHRGRSFRPSKPLHFLPPIKLTTGAEQHSFTPHETAWQKTATRGRGRERRHSRYRKMVMTIASYLTLGNVADMKFLCRDHVRPPQIVDDVTNARHLLALLENQRLLAENSLYFLQTLLYYIARPDLYQVVLDFRADRQDDYRNRGVQIKDDYQVDLGEDSQRLELANELLKFRKDLKPRRRLNQVDVSEMRRKLNDLSTKMQENIITMQRPNAPKDALEDASGLDTHDGDLLTEKGINSEEETTKDNLQSAKNSTPQKLVAQEPPPAEKCQSINQVVAGGGPQPAPAMECNESPKLKTQDGNTLPKIVQKEKTGAVTPTNQETPKTPDTERKEGSTPIKESTEDYYITNDEFETQAENFGYATPCPPPRETVLGISGTKVYDDVATSENSVKHRGVKNAYKPLTSNDRTASKLHQLRRLSREQRGSSRRGMQQKRKGNPIRKAKHSTGTVDNEETKETSKAREDLKLPDIYDKYARQTAVQYSS